MANLVRRIWDRCAQTSPQRRKRREIATSPDGPIQKRAHRQLRFEQFEHRLLLSATAPNLQPAEPSVIDGVLVGTLGDDVGRHALDAGEYHVNAVFGDYGDDLLIANSKHANNDVAIFPSPSPSVAIDRFANVLNGGHGNDTLFGSDLDDLLISRGDGREPVIAQPWDADDDPLGEIHPKSNTYYENQPIEGDDILVGGGGADLFYFQTLINAKPHIILRHVNNDGTINWGANGVAGENDNVHDHWVDRLGDELIADFSRAEGDHILIEGHTTEVYTSEYVDSDGDHIVDSTVLHLWANQGNGGGAHNKDRLGTITVAGALLTAEDYTVNQRNYGIVATIAELDEATSPYSSVPDDGLAPAISRINDGELPADAVLFVPAELTFSGDEDDYAQIEHYGDLELTDGTVALAFTADEVSDQHALFSKDGFGQQQGGHLTAFIEDGRVKVRLQSAEQSIWLQTAEASVRPGEEYHLAVTFGTEGFRLYLNGHLADSNDEFRQGIGTNLEALAIGANIWGRSDDNPLEAQHEFAGTISDFTIYGIQLRHDRIAKLSDRATERPRDEPTVIEGGLISALVNDVDSKKLVAERNDPDAVFSNDGDDWRTLNSQHGARSSSHGSPSLAIEPGRFANMRNAGHGKGGLNASDVDDRRIRHGNVRHGNVLITAEDRSA
jgi:hypothetical protein